jgi:hypothetical protein
MNSIQKEKWVKVRSKGRLKFVLVYGVLVFGTVSSILGYLSEVMVETVWSYIYSIAYEPPKPPYYLSRIVFAILIGVTTGFVIWHFNEKSYKNTDSELVVKN